jgi:hypothetical protein
VQSSDILCNNVREKLARDEVVASITVRLVRGIEIARIAKTAGFDCLYVDLEHSSLGLASTGQICMAALALGIAPFVRVPAITPEYICRVRDGGALGVIAPGIRSAVEARQVVAAAKMRPPWAPRRLRGTAASQLPQPSGRRGSRGHERCDHGDGPVRERRGDRPGRGNRRARWRRCDHDRHQRLPGGHRWARPIRQPPRQAGRCPHHCGVPRLRQARGRRWPTLAA